MQNTPENPTNLPSTPTGLPILQAVDTLKLLNPYAENVPRDEFIAALQLAIAQGGGDLEALLTLHTHVLDALFQQSLAQAIRRNQKNAYDNKFDEDRIDIALRAQKQCRNAIETLRVLQGSSLQATGIRLRKKAETELKDSR
jgi:hypothetical protein